MRLLQRSSTGEFSLTKDLVGDDTIPPYAILSHTWKDGQEVTFQDIVDGTGQSKTGYDKIRFCGQQAEHDGLRHFWVDTCCINKLTNDELSTAINSMFRWYKNATKCYVYLSDFSVPDEALDVRSYQITWEAAFRRSRWFTRGWTLQELLAPATVEFFSSEHKRLGDKISLEQQIHEITGIAIQVLRGQSLSKVGIDERMAWVAKRKTTIEEDKVYCMLGIFGIFMPLIYGEGHSHASTRLREEIERSLKRNQERPKDLQGSSGAMSKEAADLFNALAFAEQDNRFHTIRPAFDRTCNWLLTNPKYDNWLRNTCQLDCHGLLWLKGKPGSGKSTLMREAFGKAKSQAAHMNVAAFFFNARGSKLANSPLGMFRSLLQQLIAQDPSLMTQLLPTFADKQAVQGGNITWFEEELQDFLQRAFATSSTGRNVRRTLIFVDALDECEERQARSIVYYFRRLTDNAFAVGSDLSICLSSRHYPTISIDRCPEIAVENENTRDIARFLTTKLQSIPSYEPEEMIVLQNRLVQKSDGIFLWAILVVDLVLRDLDDGKPASEVQETIRNVPEELGELFTNIFGTLRVNERRTSVNLVQWVLLAQKTLTGTELYHAIGFSSEISILKAEQSDEFTKYHQTNERMRRFVRGYSRGLIEIRADMVQFIHESVREFFLSETGLNLLSLALGSNVLGDGHCTIIRACLNFIFIAHTSKGRDDLLWVDQWMIRYAWQSLPGHAALAQQHGAPHRLLQLVIEISWRVKLWSRFIVSSHLKFLSSAGLYWCAISVNEIKQLFCSQSVPYPDSLAVIVSMVKERIQQTLAHQQQVPTSLPRYVPMSTTRWNSSKDSPKSTLGIDINALGSDKDSLLHRAIEIGMSDVVSWLFSHRVKKEATNDRMRTPLHYAALYSATSVVEELIEQGVNVSARDEENNLALHLAVENPDETASLQIVKALVKAGSPVNARNIWGQTVLHCAVEVAAIIPLKYLIGVGGNLYVEDNKHQSVYTLARSCGKLTENALLNTLDPRKAWDGASTNPEKMMRSRNSHWIPWQDPSNTSLLNPYRHYSHLFVPEKSS